MTDKDYTEAEIQWYIRVFGILMAAFSFIAFLAVIGINL